MPYKTYKLDALVLVSWILFPSEILSGFSLWESIQLCVYNDQQICKSPKGLLVEKEEKLLTQLLRLSQKALTILAQFTWFGTAGPADVIHARFLKVKSKTEINK